MIRGIEAQGIAQPFFIGDAESYDRGQTWQQEKPMLSSTSESSHPSLIANGKKIYLSWTDEDNGHQFIEVN